MAYGRGRLMPWGILLDWRFWAGAAFVALGVFAAVQTGRLDHEKAAFAKFRAETESLAAAAKVKNAQIALQQAHAAQEVLDGLQTRYDALSARYGRLRANPGGGGVPNLASAASILGSCGPKPVISDPTARFLGELEAGIAGILETGDREIAKYVQLYQLDLKNASAR